MVCFIDFRVPVVDGDNHRPIVTGNDDITRIVRLPWVPQEQELGIRLFLRVGTDDLSRHDALLDIRQRSPAEPHLLRGVFGQPKLALAHPVAYTLLRRTSAP
jgi:hypothetical protein